MNETLPPLHLFARLTAGAAFFLLIAGGLVTSTGSGLAVPDWPLSFGQFFPPMVGGVFFEHGHRVIAGAVGLLTFTLGFWIHKKESRPWVKILAYVACAAIVLQAILGGMTVLFKLPAPISVSHACLGQAVFCMILALTQATSPWFIRPETSGAAKNLWKLSAAAVAAVYLQLFWGAIVRHTGQGFTLHLLWALPVTLILLFSIYKVLNNFSGQTALTHPALFLALLLPLQLALGFVAMQIRQSPTLELSFHQAAAMTTAHVGVGALILGTSVILTIRAYRLR